MLFDATDLPGYDADHYARVLRHMIDTAADFADELHQASREVAPPAPLPALAAAFERIVATVRRTVLLARDLHADPHGAERPSHVADASPGRIPARAQVIRALEDSIQAEAATPSEARSLNLELLERLDRPELNEGLEAELRHRSLDAIVRDIRRDLGLKPHLHGPFKRRTPADIATLQARAAHCPERSPSIALPPGDRPGERNSPPADDGVGEGGAPDGHTPHRRHPAPAPARDDPVAHIFAYTPRDG